MDKYPSPRAAKSQAAVNAEHAEEPVTRRADPWNMLGVVGGGLYLAVLPIAHVTALRSMAFVLALIAAIALWSAPTRRVSLVFAAFAVWLLAAGLSLLTTRDLHVSVDAMENEVLRSLLVFLVFYTLTRRLAAYDIWVAATACGIVLVSALAIGSFVAHGEWRAHYVPPLGDYATAAITVVPLLAGYIFFAERRGGIVSLALIAIAAILIAGYLTESRAFWLVLICGALVAVVSDAVQGGRLRKRSLAVLAVICIAALTLAALSSVGSLLAFDTRAMIYSVVTQKIPQIPLTGTGYGHETDHAWYAAALPGYTHSHNIVLSFIDQMGFLGLVALVMIFCAPAAVLARALRAARPEARTAAICGLALLICVFVKNSFDYFFVRQNLWLFFAHLGIYLGYVDRRS